MASRSHSQANAASSEPQSTRPLSLRQPPTSMAMASADLPPESALNLVHTLDHDHLRDKPTFDPTHDAHQATSDHPETHIGLSAISKLAGQQVAPFLAKHIPQQYHPLGGGNSPPGPQSSAEPKSNTKYCYRHRPDLKCRRQVDEPSMDELQNVGCATRPHAEWSLIE